MRPSLLYQPPLPSHTEQEECTDRVILPQPEGLKRQIGVIGIKPVKCARYQVESRLNKLNELANLFCDYCLYLTNLIVVLVSLIDI